MFAPGSPWSSFFPPGYQLSPAAQLAGNYEGLNAGVDVSHSVSTEWGWFAGADLRQHGNVGHADYNTQSLDGRFGVMFESAQNVYKLSLTAGQVDTADTMGRHSSGVSAEWQHVYSPANQVSAFAQFGQYRASGFPATSPDTDARIEGDTDLSLMGAGWVHVLADGKQVLFGSLYVGRELDVAPVIVASLPDGGRTDGKKDFYGLRLGGQMAITGEVDGMASVGWQSADYGRLNNLIMANRSETQYDLTLGLAWHIDKLWTLKPQIVYSSKSSNISLYSSDRTDASVTLRRDFK